jgi:hypothetical protein
MDARTHSTLWAGSGIREAQRNFERPPGPTGWSDTEINMMKLSIPTTAVCALSRLSGALLSSLVFAGCFGFLEPSHDEEVCDDACGFRAHELHCPNNLSACEAFCRVDYNVAAQRSSCVKEQRELVDCHYSEAALELGCNVTEEEQDKGPCKPERDALRACQAAK